MPKFTVLKTGVNEDLINKTKETVEGYMDQLFHDYEIVKIDDFYTFTFGTVTVTIQVLPWHSDDVLVKVYSYLAEDVEVTSGLTEELLR
ncbi:MAG TPA: hypothetical protein DCS93_08825, partial [Microscillaceae bacterium]|nr:hypothetical protein [Microscillaceae bacterium]